MGYTQAELARLVGVSKNSISSIETGAFSPRLETAYKLSQALGVPVQVLFPPKFCS